MTTEKTRYWPINLPVTKGIVESENSNLHSQLLISPSELKSANF